MPLDSQPTQWRHLTHNYACAERALHGATSTLVLQTHHLHTHLTREKLI